MFYNEPMTEKLYYQDTGVEEFEAEIVDLMEEKKRVGVVLDKTYFYPEGGGQPADKGWIAGIPVADVQKKNGTIVHYLTKDPGTGVVKARIDMSWRRHFMQQHTGQHIISAALFNIAQYKTVSVHMGIDTTTVEIDASAIPDEDILAAEAEANRIISQNMPMEIVNTTHTELESHNLRRPCNLEGDVRLVKIPSFDCVACGGLHVDTTGPVRLVKFDGIEKIRGHVRLAWRIGDRAFKDYSQKSDILSKLRPILDSREEEFAAKIEAMQEETAILKSRVNQLEQRLAEITAHNLLSEAAKSNDSGLQVIAHSWTDENPELIKKIMKLLMQENKTMACLVNKTDGKLQWSISSSEDLNLPLAIVKQDLLPLINGKGGGRPPLYQGIGLDPTNLDNFLTQFKQLPPKLNL
jgi:alanyl-tRNA synthetase